MGLAVRGVRCLVGLALTVLVFGPASASAQESMWERDGLEGRAVRALALAPDGGSLFGLVAGQRGRPSLWQRDGQGWSAVSNGIPDLLLALAPMSGGLLVGTGRDLSDQPGIFQIAGAGAARRIFDSQAIGALAVAPGRGGDVYAASAPWADRDGGPDLFRRDAASNAWMTVLRGNLGCPTPSYFKEIEIASSDPGTVLALEWCRTARVLQTQLWRSEDRGQTWQVLPPPSADFPLIATMAIDPADSDVLYLAGLTEANVAVAGLARSLDGGQSWVSLRGAADEMPNIKTMVLDRRNPRRVLAGTERGGAFASDDRGESWRSLPGLDSLRVWQLAIDETMGRVYAATTDGVWRTPLP